MLLDNYELVEAAIEKYAGYKKDEEKQDIRQTIYLSLLKHGKTADKRKIVRIVKEAVLQYIRESGNEFDQRSLSEPSIYRIAEGMQSRYFDSSSGLDLEHIKDLIDKLPGADQIIIRMFYGLAGEPKTLGQIAYWLGKPEIYVRRRKKLAIEKLRVLLGEKN